MSRHPIYGALIRTLFAALLVLPSLSQGRFICTKGMAEAGPACPRCHGTATAVANPCCKWVVRADSPQQANMTRGAEPSAPPSAVLPALAGPAALRCSMDVPTPSPTTSPPVASFRPTILRL